MKIAQQAIASTLNQYLQWLKSCSLLWEPRIIAKNFIASYDEPVIISMSIFSDQNSGPGKGEYFVQPLLINWEVSERWRAVQPCYTRLIRDRDMPKS